MDNQPMDPKNGYAKVIPNDNPIRRFEDDALGRSHSARLFARQVVSVDASDGAVVGVLGSWGSGKTSFINLARIELDAAGIPALDFNPWMFSGTEQLMDSFFNELTTQLRLRPGFAEIAREIAEYGEIFSGVEALLPIGPWIGVLGALMKVGSKIFGAKKVGMAEHRARLEKALLKLNRPIVVVLDDIDRLSSSELRDIFKLIRLIANFPNVIYIVAFDRKRVEIALKEDGVTGRDYLEKILQLSLDLPAVPPAVLQRQTLAAVDNALSGQKLEPFNAGLWPDVFIEIVQPLIRNMRDVRKYASAVKGAVVALEGQIELADVMALEAIRLFLPDVFGLLHATTEALTTTWGGYRDMSDPKQLKMAIDCLIEKAGDKGGVVRSLIHRIFPAADRHIGAIHYGGEFRARWLQARRVANEEIFRLYFERIPGESLLSFYDSGKAFAAMADKEAFGKHLRSLDPERLEDVIASLESFQDNFRLEHIEPGTITLLNIIPDIPQRPLGMFEFDSRFVVGRVVYRLVRSAGSSEAIETLVRKVLPDVAALSGRLELISMVGHREGTGHKLIPEAAARDLERDIRREIRAATSEALVAEWDLLRLLHFAREGSDGGEPPFEIPDSPQLTLAILQSAVTETRSQGSNSRTIRRSKRLQWEPMIGLFNSLEDFKGRLDRLKTANQQIDKALLVLVDKYLEGWRPENGRE